MSPRGTQILNQTVQLEDCSIEVKGYECCGEICYYAILPGYWINWGEETKVCCEFNCHDGPEGAIACAKERIAKGLFYRPEYQEPG